MIASKLILFSCFYLLLLDSSLGQRLLVELDGNQKLFKNAIKYGETYGGLLGLLGSQWKQLLFQLVQAKRNVGLGGVQLARFNDSTTTEEVGLAITDSYADKVAELVAIRTQDIGATQKYIDDLEILKNEIALTMIVEMDEIEEKFKEKNVRRKVKEAKENGLTDTDIKEILFADFFDSGEGLSLIGARASSPDALLSSFLDGMVSILDGNYDQKLDGNYDEKLDGTYYEKLGIIQYGNEGGDGSVDGGAGGGDKDGDNNDGGGGDGVEGGDGSSSGPPGGPPGGGGSGGPAGGPPGGGGSGGPPKGPPSGVDLPDASHEEDGNDDDEKEVDPSEDLPTHYQGCHDGLDTEDIGGEESSVQNIPLENETENATEQREAEYIVEERQSLIRTELLLFERNVSLLEIEKERLFHSDPLLNFPDGYKFSGDEDLDLALDRIDHFEPFLKRIRKLFDRFFDTFNWLHPRCRLTRLNYIFFKKLFTESREVLPPRPLPIEEFRDLTPANDMMRYFVSTEAWNELSSITQRYDAALDILRSLDKEIEEIIIAEEAFYENEYIRRLVKH